MSEKPNRRKDCQINFRVTEFEKEKLQTEADAVGMGLSEYLLECGLKKTIVKLNPDDFTSISKSLISIQQSIDEISRKSNLDEEDRRYEELRELVEDMQGVIFKTVSDIYAKYM